MTAVNFWQDPEWPNLGDHWGIELEELVTGTRTDIKGALDGSTLTQKHWSPIANRRRRDAAPPRESAGRGVCRSGQFIGRRDENSHAIADRLHRADHGGPRGARFRADGRRHQYRAAEPRVQQSRQRLCRLRQFFRALFSDPRFLNSVWVSVEWEVITVFATMAVAIPLAVLMFEATSPNVRNALCVLFIVPVLLPRVSAAFVCASPSIRSSGSRSIRSGSSPATR